MRLQASHPEPHVRGDPDSPFSTAKRWDDAHPPAALKSAAFGGTGGAFAITESQDLDRVRATFCCCQRPRRSKSNLGKGRNARAPSAHSRALLEYPPAIHPRKSPVAAGFAAIIRQASGTHVRCVHFAPALSTSQQKTRTHL